MNDQQKIHILSQELVGMIDELDHDAKQIVLDHISGCHECQQLYHQRLTNVGNPSGTIIVEPKQPEPFKKIIQFNRNLKLVMFLVRTFIVVCILYTSFYFYNWDLAGLAAIEYIKNTVFLIYFPAIIFLTIFTMTFFNKKWFMLFILLDFIIIFFLDTFMLIFFN
ncbi:hypothetical protein SAMN04488134_102318 [Amphibacillus marinus]|uniref:Zinc-finger n=1 Tax=Amphibacillus marinus TaxID=872970 RepID=A0A1H8KKU3_9BACI|nr:hypothetical protein [Amphibacillus marinus]SEN93311.1 hypothetical protein SAMN04488134_102318 [Amphibacillus marinus]